MLQLYTPKNNSLIPMLTDIQKDILKKRILYDNDENSNPIEVIFNWDIAGEVLFEISTNASFKKPVSYRAKGHIELTNFKSGQTYYWRVSNNERKSLIYKFTTKAELPRLIKVDGLSNVRDFGGWQVGLTQHIKQGMIYRGCELNNNMKISPLGISIMSNELHIKTVLDLRHQNETVEDVYKKQYVNIPISAYEYYFQNPEANYKIMRFLCEKNNYPIYIHCCSGADRTGTLISLIKFMLGVNKADVVADYEASNLSVFGERNSNSEKFKKFIKSITEMSGISYKDKVESFMRQSGVSKGMINKLSRILLESDK